VADIRITKTGRVLYRIDDELAVVLVESGLAERYVKPLPAPKEATYAIISAPMTGKFAIACRKYSADGRVTEETFWSGTPEGALQAFREIPVEIVEQYRKALAGATTIGSAEARREREAQARQQLEEIMRLQNARHLREEAR